MASVDDHESASGKPGQRVSNRGRLEPPLDACKAKAVVGMPCSLQVGALFRTDILAFCRYPGAKSDGQRLDRVRNLWLIDYWKDRSERSSWLERPSNNVLGVAILDRNERYIHAWHWWIPRYCVVDTQSFHFAGVALQSPRDTLLRTMRLWWKRRGSDIIM